MSCLHIFYKTDNEYEYEMDSFSYSYSLSMLTLSNVDKVTIYFLCSI